MKEKIYTYEIKDIYGDEYIVNAKTIKEAKEKLQMVHGILDDEVEDWNILGLWDNA